MKLGKLHCQITDASMSKTEKVKISWLKEDKAPKPQSQSVETTKLQSQTPCSFPDVDFNSPQPKHLLLLPWPATS